MPASDTKSHASLNGLYVKAQELDRGHAEAPAWKMAPPGASAEGADSRASTQATSHASSHASDASVKARGGSSPDFSLAYDAAAKSYMLSFYCFDTPNTVTLHGIDSLDTNLEHRLLEIRTICMHLHDLWSFTIPESDIARMNKRSTLIAVDKATAQLMREMVAFHDREPLFDFTIGPLSYLWKFAKHLPSEERIAKALAHVGADKVSVENCSISKSDERTVVDVGGAAKGFAADLLAKALRKTGVASAEINLGGNLYMLGEHPAGRPWRIDIEIPHDVPARPIALDVSDTSVVTSGSYERFVTIDGKQYQHIIDPRTGWPSTSDIVSATVVAESSLMADMLATVICIAGAEEFEAVSARHPECRIIAIRSNGDVLDSR